MSAKPLVSVVVPIYDRLQFLPQLLAPIDAQDYQNFEIISG